MSRICWYSSGVRLCSSTSSRLIAARNLSCRVNSDGRPPKYCGRGGLPRNGVDQGLKKDPAIRGAERRSHCSLRMRHHAQKLRSRLQMPAMLSSDRWDWPRDCSVRGAIAEENLVVALFRLRASPGRRSSCLRRVRWEFEAPDRCGRVVKGVYVVSTRTWTWRQMKRSPGCAWSPGKKAGFAENLEAVADADDQAARARESRDGSITVKSARWRRCADSRRRRIRQAE